MKKTYLVSPNFDIVPPPDGPFKLGHIIPGPSKTEIEPINTESHVEVIPLPPMTRKGFSSTRSNLIGGELGIWAQIMAMMGARGSVGHDTSSDDELTVREIETQIFQPTVDYVTRSVEDADVMQFLKQSKYRVPIFMITGLKIARGAATMKGHNSPLKASGEPDVPIENVQIGPVIKFEKRRAKSECLNETSDFVLAFRLQRIRFRLIKGNMEIRDRETYTKGAEMMESEVQVADGPELIGLEEGAEDLNVMMPSKSEGEGYDDDGELCDVVLLREEV